MVTSFKHRGLKELYERGSSAKVRADLKKRILVRLDVLREALPLRDLNRPGFDFHPLRGSPQCYSIHVNGPWCITFEFEEGNALRVDLEQYH
jgi:proteic killer suppression protein